MAKVRALGTRLKCRKMASKEIKGLLKNARESIRNKEFKDALKHCKGVLKLDKANYNALVFIGVCAKEMNQPDQAQAAYKRAIETDDSQLLAWQGLASLYEREADNEDFQANLPEVYRKMIDLYQRNDKDKVKEFSLKLADLFCQQGKHFEAVKTLEETVKNCGNSQENYEVYLKMEAILQEKESGDLKVLMKLSNVYKTLVHTEWTFTGQDKMLAHYTSYIKVLYEIMEHNYDTSSKQQLIDECKAMSVMFPSAVYPLDVLGKIYLASTPTISSNTEVPDVFETLCSLDPCSDIGKIGLGWDLLVKHNYEDSMLLLQQGLEGYSECPTGWLYLSHVHCHFHDYISAEKCLLKGLGSLDVIKAKDLRSVISYKLRLNLGKCLCKQGRQQAEKAKELLLDLISFGGDDPEVLTSLGESSLILDDMIDASEYCSKALNIDKTYHSALALQGRISAKEGLFDDAELRFLEAIELCRDCPLYYFFLGQLYWDMAGEFRTDKEKCLMHLLKAAKLDPNYPPTFLYLGHYYREVLTDINKACRCYQKAFDLDDKNDEAGCYLGDLLTKLDKEDDALKLFSDVTSRALPGKAKWAWIRLGLYYLKNDHSNEAITCFQSALRGDPKDSQCWECLGESYMSRGSFTAALKAFTRSSELETSSLYSLYQIAAIKQSLCVYQEALEEYQLILDRQPGYVPALKGYGETHLCLARSAIKEDFNKRAVDHVNKGLAALSRAVESRPNMSCLWKLIGDCCVVVDPLPDYMVSVDLSEILQSAATGVPNEPTEKRKLLSLATSAYGKALKSQPQCSSLWNDLGLSYYLQAKIENGEQRKKMSDRCLQVLKKGLSLDRTNHTLWNTLGVVCASPVVNNPYLSQHAFIMSIKAEPNNPVAWTNLGVLYLKHSKIEPANEAFKNAQALEPSYTTAWVGQASIAETIGHEEAEDLFRHALELGSNVEGSIGYAYWVCLTSVNSTKNNTPKPSLSHLPDNKKLAVTQSSVAMTKYTDRILSVASAFNLHGLLLEHQCLYKQAAQAFKSSLNLLESKSADQDFLNIVNVNHARVLSSLGKHTEAIESYQKVEPLNRFHDICGLALSLYMAGNLPESYRAYEQALQLAESQEDKSCLLTAMGMLGYAVDDHDGAKAVLLKSSQLSPPCERGLIALCALGLVRKEMTLAGAALSELLKLEHKQKEAIYSDICFLFSRFFVIQGNPTVGLRHILKAVHEHPDRGNLWEQCTSFMVEVYPDDLQVASRCAESTRKLKRLGDEVNVSLQPATLLGSGCVPTTRSQQILTADRRTEEALRAAQIAVRAHPDHLESWGVLCASLTARGVALKKAKKGNVLPAIAMALSNFTMLNCIKELKELEAKSKFQLKTLTLSRKNELLALQKWTAVHTGYSMMHCGLLNDAIKHCDEGLSDYSDDPQTCTNLHFLKAQIHFCTAVSSMEGALNHLQTSVLSSPYHSHVAWQVLAEVHIKLGSPMAAELCYRKCLQAGIDKRSTSWKIVPLLRLGLLALNQSKIEFTERQHWLTLCQEASTEVLKINPDCVAARLIQGIGCHLQGNARQAKRFLQSSVDSCSSASSIAQHWLSLSTNK